MRAVKFKKIILAVVIFLWLLMMGGAITLPAAAILVAAKLEGLVGSLVLVALALTMSNGAMTTVRNVDRFTPSRRSMMITAASMTYAGTAPYTIGILILLLLKFTGKVSEAMGWFWLCSGLLGLGAVLMLLGVITMSLLHGQNAWLEGIQGEPRTAPEKLSEGKTTH